MVFYGRRNPKAKMPGTPQKSQWALNVYKSLSTVTVTWEACWGLADIFCIGPDSKHVRLHRSDGLCCIANTQPCKCSAEAPSQIIYKPMGMAVFQ